MGARFLIGDVFAQLETLEDDSVDLVLTSPPFLALRSYLPADHPDKHLEGGSQATPGEFIDWLVDVVEALDRVLAPHGSMCIELGDTYAGGTGEYHRYETYRDGTDKNAEHPGSPTKGSGWPLAKSLTLIPELFRLSLVYGTNPLTGRQTEPWRLRNVIRWVRPNPPVGALGDKFRPATSELMVFCKSAKRYFDLDAVRSPHQSDPAKFTGNGYEKGRPEGLGHGKVSEPGNPAGAPPLDWWQIPTHPYKGAHYATWPPALCVKPIKAMCPERVCLVCGEPSRRIVKLEPSAFRSGEYVEEKDRDRRHNQMTAAGKGGFRPRQVNHATRSDCGHNNWRPGHVLDPFAGTGTVLAVATGHGRDATGIDLDPRNADLALGRVGPLILTVEGDDR